jgi:hypothetical protein
VIRKTSKQIGRFSGSVIGEPIKFLGNRLKNEFITDVGETVKQTSIHSFDSVGQAIEGAWNTSSGYAQKDQTKVQKGLDDLKDFTVKTGKGVAEAVKHTVQNGEDVYKGIRDGDQERILEGSKGLAKTLAVTSLAVVAVDFLDISDGADEASAQTIQAGEVDPNVSTESMELDYSNQDYSTAGSIDLNKESNSSHDFSDSDYMETRNEDLIGQIHPETGVPFVEHEVPLPSGETVIGVFPDFDEAYATSIPDWMYQYSDSQQFHYANMQLSYVVETDAALADTFTDAQLQQIANGQTPDGYTWHHSEIPGRLELVDTDTHGQTAHTGGRELWGGGEAQRG